MYALQHVIVMILFEKLETTRNGDDYTQKNKMYTGILEAVYVTPETSLTL